MIVIKIIKIIVSCLIGYLIGYSLTYLMFEYTDIDKYKDYIVEHQDEIIESYGDDWYIINSCEFKYVNDITISKISDGVSNVIFWGDRESWLWRFKKDIVFEINILEDFSTNKNRMRDLEIIKKINEL